MVGRLEPSGQILPWPRISSVAGWRGRIVRSPGATAGCSWRNRQGTLGR